MLRFCKDKIVKIVTWGGSRTVKTVPHEMSNPIVEVSQGKLKGAVRNLLDGTPYYSFKGVPYAAPPVGDLRFMAPQPLKPWQGVLEAIDHGSVCPQFDFFSQQIVDGNEDCLFLNVFSKSLNSNSKTPVMVFIHGGGFMSGSGDAEPSGPEFLLQHNVVLVTFNYRLEVLGFLCLDTPEVPGNAGMKDQVAALKWVKENIESFGGDSNNITLFGESAGSASVIYHMQSPMSKGLFHKAIAQSGVSIQDWAQGTDGKERAFKIAKVLGKEINDTKELLQFLKTLPANQLARMTFKTATEDEKRRELPIHFAPVVEKKFDGVEPFITEKPIDALLSRKFHSVPLIIGYTSLEGVLLTIDFMKSLELFNENIHYFVPREISQRVSVQQLKDMGEKIRNFYIGDRKVTTEDTEHITNLLTDLRFAYQTHRFSDFYANLYQQPYMYRFNCDTDLNMIKRFGGFELKGASHADDLFYLFCGTLNKDAYTEQEKLRDIVFKVTKLWTDFAATGNPTPDNVLKVSWPPYSPTTKHFLDINEELTTGVFAERERIEFWNKLHREAGLPCIAKSSL